MAALLLALCLAAQPATAASDAGSDLPPAAPADARPAAVGAERYDHHGAVSLLLGVDGARKDTGGQNVVPDTGWRAGLDVGGTLNVGYASDELMLMGRLAFGGQQVESSLYGGYRSYFGHDRVKTVADLDLALHLTPYLTGGARVALGLQYELSSIAGVYAAIAGQLGFGQVVMFKAELVFGVQLRSFLLE